MKVFIAGATGVLGNRVVKQLIAQGHQVVGLARSQSNKLFLESLGAQTRTGDLFNPQEMIEITEGCDAILHLATKIPVGPKTKPRDWVENDRIRIEGSKNLTHAAIYHGVSLYLQQSVLFIYGDHQGKELNDSTKFPDRQPFYLESAVTMENIVSCKIRNEGLKGVILRFGSFYGPDCEHTRHMIYSLKQGKLPIVGNGDYFYNLIHVADAASAVVFAVNNHEHLAGKTFNISDFNPSPFKEVMHYISSITDSKQPSQVPLWLAKLFVGSDLVKFLTNSYQNKVNELKGWNPKFSSYQKGFDQVVYHFQKWDPFEVT